MDSIGIIRLSSLGDIILTEPVSRALKNNFPQTRITFFTKEIYRPLLEMFPSVEEIIGLEIPGSDEKISGLKGRVRALPYDFDLVLDLHKNIRSRIINKNLKSFRRLTYKKERFFRQFAVWFKSRKIRPHTVDKYLAVLDDLMVICSDRIPRLNITEEAERQADDFLDKIGFVSGEYAVLAVGASHPVKHYPIERFAELTEIIVERYNRKILVVEAEHFGYMNLFEKINSRGNLEYGIGLDISVLAGVIKKARLTVSNDSGVMHLSAGVGTPTAGLFGPTHPVLGFSPLGDNALAITSNEKCSPCSLHGERLCYRDKQYCFLNMSPEVIVKMVERYLR